MALIQHAWAGEPGESESIKYVNGNESARNLIVYGEKPHTPSTDAEISYDDDGYLQLTRVGGTRIPYAAFVTVQSVYMPEFPEPGETFTVTFEVKSSNGRGEVGLYLGRNQTTYYRTDGEMGTEFSTFSLTREWPEDGNWRPHFQFSNDETDVTYTLRHVKVELGGTVTPYWDGDTPDYYDNATPKVYLEHGWATLAPRFYI